MTFKEVLDFVRGGEYIVPTLGGKRAFQVKEEFGVLKLTNSKGTTRIVNESFFNLVWDKNVSDIGDASCKITSFLQFFSTQASAVLLVRIYFYEFSCQIFHNYVLKLVTIDEVLLNIKFDKWRKTYFGFKDAFLTGIAVLSIIYIFNFIFR